MSRQGEASTRVGDPVTRTRVGETSGRAALAPDAAALGCAVLGAGTAVGRASAPAAARRFVDTALENQLNRLLLQRLSALDLPDCWLVAGCLFQAVWNRQCGRAPEAGVKDYDIFYFDAADLSWDAEDRAIQRARAVLADLGITFDLKNQARVHLWYERRFGVPCPQLTSAADGMRRFLVAGTCIGLSIPGNRCVRLYAPFGLADTFDGILRPNPLNSDPVAAFLAKAESYRARWPHLRIVPEMAAGALQPEVVISHVAVS